MHFKRFTFETISSTNDEAMRLALEGAEPFTVVVADSQSAGRGRNGHDWTSPPGVGLYASLILRPDVSVDRVPMMTLLVGVAAAEAIRSLSGLDAGLKWPNDVLVNLHKVAGILCEAVFPPGGGRPIVIAGLGVNVNTLPRDLPERPLFAASSLAAESGRCHDRDALLERWVERTRHWLDVIENGRVEELVETWRTLDALRGRRLGVSVPDGSTVVGSDCGVDEEGRLLLRLDDGTLWPVMAGDVKMRE